MARLIGIDPSQAEPDVAERMRRQIQAYGRPSEGTAITARRPTIARAFAGMFAAIDASGLLPKALRHVVNRRVALRVGCQYWADLNAAGGSAEGIADEKLLSLGVYETSPLFDERERAALALADAITSTPQAVDDAVFSRAQTYFTPDELVELVMVAAWENTVARYNHALGVESMNLWRS